MTGPEIAVIVGGLALGFWIVSVFMPHAMQPKSGAPQGHPGPESERPQADDSARQHQPVQEELLSQPWYQVLGVDERASHAQIVAAYKIKIGQYHPDKVSRMGEEIRRLAEVKSTQINAAYEQAMRIP